MIRDSISAYLISLIGRVEWGETGGKAPPPTPLKDCVFVFSETTVKCVQKSYHSFSDNDML